MSIPRDARSWRKLIREREQQRSQYWDSHGYLDAQVHFDEAGTCIEAIEEIQLIDIEESEHLWMDGFRVH